jgi:hypothetical protein
MLELCGELPDQLTEGKTSTWNQKTLITETTGDSPLPSFQTNTHRGVWENEQILQ